MLVIHGSALLGVEPRDLDVIYTGEWTPDMEQDVREWAASVGLRPDLPLDAHQAEGDRDRPVTVPAPCEPEFARFVVLRGSPGAVRVQVWRDFSSGLRAYAHDPDHFLALLASGEFGNKVSLMPTAERPDYGSRFGVPWDMYCTGITAFRSAVRTAPSTAEEILDRLGGGGELLWVVYRGAEPTRNWKAAPNTPGGVEGHGDGWSQAISLAVSASGAWTVAGRKFPSVDAAADWLGLVA